MRAAAAHVGPDLLDRARAGLHRTSPGRSAKRVFTFLQLFVFAGIGYGVFAAFRAQPAMAYRAAFGVLYALFVITILWRLLAAAVLQRVRTPLWSPRAGDAWPVYTVLCPLYREANVAPDLIAALERLDYPKDRLDVQILVEAADADTMAAALAAVRGSHIEVVVIPRAAPQTKPKALNVGLARARGAFIAVFDAEDRPHPQQLRAALAAFEQGGDELACVQAPLVIDNAASSWIAGQFAAEYAVQFREILPLLARLKLPLPLGGSSNHIRTAALEAVGGWDAWNVTEDADLGYRFARDGYHCGVIEPPTWEEAPSELGAWLSQRTRWIKGHMQTWLVLMRNPLRTAREMGLGAFVVTQLCLLGAILAAAVHGPFALWVLWAIVSPENILGTGGFILTVAGYSVAMFASMTATALSGEFRHLGAFLTMPLYWPLATVAFLRAFLELVFVPHHWSKTRHGVSVRESFAAEHGAGASRESAAFSRAA